MALWENGPQMVHGYSTNLEGKVDYTAGSSAVALFLIEFTSDLLLVLPFLQ